MGGSPVLQALADMLYRSASEHGYLNPDKVEEILGIQKSEEDVGVKQRDTLQLEFENMADELRPYTENDMKIQQVPWVEEYFDMKTNYTDLTLHKIENSAKGQNFIPIKDYKELFQETKKAGKQGRRRKRKTVIFSGIPGIGKSTMCKKVTWDWATGIFTTFTIVFLVSMQFIKPGDTVESIIIQQTPALEGLGISEKKLKRFLDSFGNRCLIILDGYDEFIAANKENTDLTKFLKGRKFLNCSMFMTSRPHCKDEVKALFQSYVQIQGFSREKARGFACSVLRNQDHLPLVMEIQCINTGSHLKKGVSLYASPMLLLFVCILANHEEIDLSRKDTTLGEIYFRLLRLIYRKFVVRRNIHFNQSDFLNVLKRVGEIATDTYTTGNYLRQTRDVIKVVGPDCFQYGFLIGHKDSRLLKDETADIFLSYPHRSIEELLLAFFFAIMANDGTVILQEENVWLLFNPLVLKFCLWLLYCDKEYIVIKEREYIISTLVEFMLYVVNNAHIEFLDAEILYPTFNPVEAMNESNKLYLKFFCDILSNCCRTRHLTFYSDISVDWTLRVMADVFNHFRSITLSLHEAPIRDIPLDVQDLFAQDVTCLKLTIYNSTLHNNLLNDLLAHCKRNKRKTSVYLLESIPGPFEMSHVVLENIEKLHLEGIGGPIIQSQLVANNRLPSCPHLTHICFSKLNISENVLSSLSDAVKAGDLPQLSHLSFNQCGSDVRGKLDKLFKCHWSQVSELVLSKCEVNLSDINILSKGFIPNLTAVTLFLRSIIEPMKGKNSRRRETVRRLEKFKQDSIMKLFVPTLRRIHLQEIDVYTCRKIFKLLNTDNGITLTELSLSITTSGTEEKILARLLPLNFETLRSLALVRFIRSDSQIELLNQSSILFKLEKLNLSQSSGLTGKLSNLLIHCFPKLSYLTLSYCRLMFDDLRSLAKANQDGRLPELKELDISHNDSLAGEICHLFGQSSVWSKLVDLNINDCGTALNSEHSELNPHHLVSLQDLRCSVRQHFHFPLSGRLGRPRWEQLRTITISTEDDNDCCQLLKHLVKLVELKLLPLLEFILLINQHLPHSKAGCALRQELRKSNISVNCYNYFIPEPLRHPTD